MRLALQKDFDELNKLDHDSLTYSWLHKRDKVVQKISQEIDTEINETPLWDLSALFTAINSERLFRMDVSEPFQRAFSGKDILMRYKRKNK